MHSWSCSIPSTISAGNFLLHSGPGTRFYSYHFSPDRIRLVAACTDSKIRLFDWRLARELIALAGITMEVYNPALALSLDGLTKAYEGFSPSLRIAKALPWVVDRGTTRRIAARSMNCGPSRLWPVNNYQWW